MKTHITIKMVLFCLFLLPLKAYAAASVSSFGVTPSTIEVGDSYRFYMNFSENLPSGYDIRLSASTSTSATSAKMRGGQRNWYATGVSNKVTTQTLYFHLFKDGVNQGYLGRKATLTVKLAAPTLSGGVNIVPVTSGFRINSQEASGEDRYEFYRSTSSGSLGSKIGSGSSRYYTDTSGLVHNRTYYYTVKACNSSGCDTSSQNYSRYTAPPPTLSGGVNISSVTGGFRINSQEASGEDRYEFYRSTSSGSLGSKIGSGSSRYYTDTGGLVHNRTYYYTIKACNSSGCDTSSQDSSRYSAPPTLSGGVNIVSVTGGLKINSQDASNEDRYEFYRSTSSGSLGSKIGSGSSRYHTDTASLVHNTTYYYRIKACNSSGCVTSSQNYYKYIAPPTLSGGVNIVPVTGGLKINSQNASNEDRYEFYRSTSSGSLGSKIGSGSSRYHTDTASLVHNTTYYYRIKACNSSGCVTTSQNYYKYVVDPKVNSLTASPAQPKMFEAITFTAKSDVTTSNVKFKCGGGGWKSSDTSSNSGKTWTYTRDVGLKAQTTCDVDIDNDGSSDKSLSVSVGNPKFIVSKSIAAPKVGDSVKFTVDTDQIIETDYKLQIKFSSLWYDMASSASRDSWFVDRAFESVGDKTVYFRILNPSGSSIYDTTSTLTVGEATTSEIISFLNQDPLVAKMSLELNQEDALARADAVVLIDRMRALLKSSIDKNMSAYYNPFADAASSAEYLPSLIRLSYYKSNFSETVIEKDALFNPMRHMTREEFVKVVINAFDLPKTSSDLTGFSDTPDLASWAGKYFQTAVHYGVIVGNQGKLLPKDKVSIKEALIVLRRIKDKFPSVPFDSSRYELPESLDSAQLYVKTIGYEYEPRYYKPDAKPTIDISGIIKSKVGNYYVLTVSSTMDVAKGASGYYWWSTDKGYFREAGNNSNSDYKTVHFYPMSSKPITDYHITVRGGDNLGYVDKYDITIDKDVFTYLEDGQIAPGIQADLSNIQVDQNLVANKLFKVNLSGIAVKKSNLELGVDQAVVIMVAEGEEYSLFHGTPDDDKLQFVIGDYADLYGKNVLLKIELYSQAKKLTTAKQFNLPYTPQFVIQGRVYNTDSGTPISSVLVNGIHEVNLDENNEFYYSFDTTAVVSNLEVKAIGGDELNYFEPVTTSLNYDTPTKYVVLTGEDGRQSLNLTISPIHVPSGELVTFKLTADKNIPTNAVIELEQSSCGSPSGLGGKSVEISCTTEVTDTISYMSMSIGSSKLYGGGLIRTVVVDPTLNDSDADGVLNEVDNCPASANPLQENNDSDLRGDACDSDDDNDTIPDTWELQYGLDPFNADDALLDSDGDGISNIDEYVKGTNPLIAANDASIVIPIILQYLLEN